MIFKNISGCLKHDLISSISSVKSLLSEILEMMNGKQAFALYSTSLQSFKIQA